MFSPELSAKLAMWRAKVADNSITQAELQEAVRLLREERRSAVESSAKKRARAAKAEVNADDLLKDLEGM